MINTHKYAYFCLYNEICRNFIDKYYIPVYIKYMKRKLRGKQKNSYMWHLAYRMAKEHGAPERRARLWAKIWSAPDKPSKRYF